MIEHGKLTRDGWTHKTDHDSVQIGGKQYRNMREWVKPCIICSSDIVMFEKPGATVLNSGFGVKTCTDHRGLMPAFQKQLLAWSGGRIIAGTAITGETSRPVTTPADTQELESLRMFKATVSEELKELDSLRREVVSLKTQLGTAGWSPQDTTTDRLRREFAAKLEAGKPRPAIITGGFVPGPHATLEPHDAALDALRTRPAKSPWEA